MNMRNRGWNFEAQSTLGFLENIWVDFRLILTFSANPRNSGSSSKRLLPMSKYNEYDEPLPTVNASGHFMMTAGLGSEQYFWCNICCAYSGDRVRKLARDCDRIPRTVPAVSNLRKDLHPFKGTTLSVPARRMLKADIGNKLSLLDPLACTTSVDAWLPSDMLDPMVCTASVDVSLPSDMLDPLVSTEDTSTEVTVVHGCGDHATHRHGCGDLSHYRDLCT